MTEKNPYEIVKRRHITEKAIVLQELHKAKSNKSLARCENPKYVFIVDRQANKHEIKKAVEAIYSEKKIKVVSVNTIQVKAKPTRHLRKGGGRGLKKAYKKAIVTLEPQDILDNV